RRAAQKVTQRGARPLRLLGYGDLVVVAAAVAGEAGLAMVIIPDRLRGRVRELALLATALARAHTRRPVGRGDPPVMAALRNSRLGALDRHAISHLSPLNPPHPCHRGYVLTHSPDSSIYHAVSKASRFLRKVQYPPCKP